MSPVSDPERSIGFLITDVSRLLRRNFDRRVRALGLTQVQWRAIAHLAREEGLKQAELAERLEVTPITIARLIDRLQAAGWVTRHADPDDRRAARLRLTVKCQPILATMRGHAAEALEEALAGVSHTARKQLLRALLRVKQNLSASESGTSATPMENTTSDVRKRQRS